MPDRRIPPRVDRPSPPPPPPPPLAGDLPQRVAAVLADATEVMPPHLSTWSGHWDTCWRIHIGCLAARVTRTLTGEDK